ncbi:MAG TPA: YgiQ family radical SAM protein [Syntrophorhabdaceae bacterium]|nr:YgiQ family radical SAM protein [Syntrophorhabdaceae bacterium]HRR70840.1 YgiQ family radical SAM protein [Syntrophorhabdaceae bacterium]
MRKGFLPISIEEVREKGWDTLDIILITGDAYVDHPSYGTAIIGRVLEDAGYKVGIIAQPDWKSIDDFKKLGRPRLFFGITAGNMDSMVANYTANKKPRRKDDYSPGGKIGLRPDRATIVYANRVREAFGDITIVIGGIEASLRRFAHYDWWDNDVRRSIIFDSRADILVYGMGEKQVVEIAHRVKKGIGLRGIRGTAVIVKDREDITREELDIIEVPSYEEIKEDKKKFNEAFRQTYRNQDPFRAKVLIQRHGNRYVVQYPPALPLKTSELDAIYRLPFARDIHPSYKKIGGIPGFETVRFSIVSHRGCCGECSFCGLSMHQGRIIQSRSKESIIEEARLLTERKDFRGTITDIGGPTANLYKAECPLWDKKGTCTEKHCLMPKRCKNLHIGYSDAIELLSKVLSLPKVKHVFIESGIRYDLLVDRGSTEYLIQLCKNHISGQMKVAPEHCINRILKLMNKPHIEIYEEFANRYKEINRRLKKEQYLVHYFICGHPGSTLEDAYLTSLYLKRRGIYPEQIQDFIPLPMTASGCMYYTEEHPFTGEKLYVAKTFKERKMHRALIQYKNEKNRKLIQEAEKILSTI